MQFMPSKFQDKISLTTDSWYAFKLTDSMTDNNCWVKQALGCVLAPTLFNMMFTAMLTDAVYNVEEKSHSDIYMETYTTCVGCRYKWSRPTKLQCVTSCWQMTVRLTLPPKHITNWASIVFLLLPITLRGVQSVPKKLTFYTSLPLRRRVWYTGQHCQRGNFQDRWQRLTYLVSTLSRSAQMDDEVNSRIAKSSSVYGRLSDTVWQKRGSWKNSHARQRCCLHYCMPVKHAHYTSATFKRLTNFAITA